MDFTHPIQPYSSFMSLAQLFPVSFSPGLPCYIDAMASTVGAPGCRSLPLMILCYDCTVVCSAFFPLMVPAVLRIRETPAVIFNWVIWLSVEPVIWIFFFSSSFWNVIMTRCGGSVDLFQMEPMRCQVGIILLITGCTPGTAGVYVHCSTVLLSLLLPDVHGPSSVILPSA